MKPEWMPVNPCPCDKYRQGDLAEKCLQCFLPVYYSERKDAQRKLLEYLIANPSQGVGNCVTISSLKLKLKELEEK